MIRISQIPTDKILRTGQKCSNPYSFDATKIKKKKKKWRTANLCRGGTSSQFSGGSSVPKISAVPERRRSRRDASSATSILNSLSLASLNCRDGEGAAIPPNSEDRRRRWRGRGVPAGDKVGDFPGVGDGDGARRRRRSGRTCKCHSAGPSFQIWARRFRCAIL